MANSPFTKEPFVVEPRSGPPQRNQRYLLRDLLWGGGGLIVGAILMLIILVFIAPQPRAATPQPQAPVTIGDVSVNIDDAFLTHYIRGQLKQSNFPVPISDLSAEIQPNDQVLLTGNVTLFPGVGPRRFSSEAQLYITHGKLAIHLTNATIGGFAAPGFLTSPLESSINQQLATIVNGVLPGNQNLIATHISTYPHHMVLAFKAS